MEDILAQAKRVAEEAEVFRVSLEETPVGFEANRLKNIQSKQSSSVALRIVRKGRIGYATSTDGSNWTRQRLVIPEGAPGSFDADSADYVSVLVDGAEYNVGPSLREPICPLHHRPTSYGSLRLPHPVLSCSGVVRASYHTDSELVRWHGQPY